MTLPPPEFQIGVPDALLTLPNPRGGLTVTAKSRFAPAQVIKGRALLSTRRTPLREWDVTISGIYPSESASLLEFFIHTGPPYVWVDPEAVDGETAQVVVDGMVRTPLYASPRVGQQWPEDISFTLIEVG